MEKVTAKTLRVGSMQTNCYLIVDNKTKTTLIIDPGDDSDYITRIILDLNVTPTKIIATHGHFDHILAVYELKQTFNIPFLIQKKDLFLVKDLVKRARYYLPDVYPIVPTVDQFLEDGQKIDFGNSLIRIIETPGHTPGSICLYLKEQNLLFTGDTLFAQGGIGRTDLSYSSNKDIQTSIKKLFSLPKSIIILPGHGESSTLENEAKI